MVHTLFASLLQWLGLALVAFLIIFFLFYKFVFLRDPARQIPPGETIVSPADGNIAAIVDITGKNTLEIPKGRWGKIKTMASDVKNAKYLILIVMNVWHVHVNRAPIAGKITKMKHVPGKFVNAVREADKFPTIENERLEIVYESPELTAKTIQIAGVLARRIQPFVRKGERVLKGQRIGRILLGSQVALILPKKVTLNVSVGEEVKAGSTIIGEWSR